MYNVYMFCLSNVSYLSGNAVVPLSKLGQPQMAHFHRDPLSLKVLLSMTLMCQL